MNKEEEQNTITENIKLLERQIALEKREWSQAKGV